MSARHGAQDFSASRRERGETSRAKRAVAHQGHLLADAPGKHLGFHVARLQVVEDLVAGDAPGTGDAQRLLEVLDVEIAEAPASNFSGLHQRLEGGHGVLQGVGARPMEQVTVQAVRAAASAGCAHTPEASPPGWHWRAALCSPGKPRPDARRALRPPSPPPARGRRARRCRRG